MIEVGLGIALFTSLIMCLALLILAARSKLIETGVVSVTVNESTVIETPVGTRLLSALADASIYLPSGCGGVGTCGQCRVRVLHGGGAILPIERARISKREADQGQRLACQVNVKRDLAVAVAAEIFGVQRWLCRVRSSRNVAPLIKELVLDLPEGRTIDFRAGSFVEVTCPAYEFDFSELDIEPKFHTEWEQLNLQRYAVRSTAPAARAYSMASYPEENHIITLLIRLALPPPGTPEGVSPGIVSSYLFSLRPRDEVAIAGPYGQFFAKDTASEMVFVGGGVGMAPMRSHIFDQLLRRRSTRKMSFWYGARSLRDLFYIEDFDRLQASHDNFHWFVALSEAIAEDHWSGYTGFIHEVLYEHYLKNHPAPEDCEYYLCGPPMMLKATLLLLDSLGVESDNILFDDFGG